MINNNFKSLSWISKNQKYLLKNIHHRKPIHKHSHPREMAALEKEIEKLSHEKNKRQTNLQNFFEKALQDSFIVELLSGKFESKDLAAYNKKRRLSYVDQMQLVAEGRLVDHHISNKLRLELSPADSDMNLISCSTQGSNEDVESLQKNLYEGELIGMQTIVNVDGKESEIRVSSNQNVANEAIYPAEPKEVSGTVQVEVAARHEVNDVFWEQFLTKRPFYSDYEEAKSN
ncbi:heat stress transcription factor-like protein [Medicago truncatula]|uniref:Heat stress transcription factor-like protein n=1 Tax=Medicago truncatula TaxID=3880 RepID=G7KJH7_MEDTR|nr:heat stress transcription factor-like protein [Medicago truncatula]